MMNKLFKFFKKPRYLKQIVILGLIIGIFVGAGLAYAVNQPNSTYTYSRDDIVDNLSMANNFAVFARDFTNNNHMEGTVAVKNLNGASSNMGNTSSVYTYNEESKLTITINKRLYGPITGEQTFTIGAYQKASDNSYTLIQSVDITTDETGKGSASMNTDGLLPGTQYYFFEIDDNGNPITGNAGIINGTEYTVTVSSSSSNTITTPTLGVGNVSYIENFYNGNDSINLFQSNAKDQPSVIIGQENSYSSQDNSNNFVYGVDGTRYMLGPDTTVNQVTGDFPIDFESELARLANFSSELAKAVNSDSVKVVNAALNSNGTELDYANITTNGQSVGIKDNNDWNNYGLSTDGKFLVINVDCTNAINNDNKITIKGCKIDGQNPQNWNQIANSVLWNFYTINSDGSYLAYDGKISYEGGLGTLLAPEATISCVYSTNGSVIGSNVDHPSCEIHHIKIIDGTSTTTTNYTVNVTNEPGETGSLKIAKNVTVNGKTASDKTKELVNRTYKFNILNADNEIVREGITVNVTNGISGESDIISGLEPGVYTVKEDTSSLPEGMSLVGDNGVQVTVEANNTANIPTARFTNNINVGSVIIRKNVKLNDESTTTNAVDGTYNFTLVNNDNQSITYSLSIDIVNGKSNTGRLDTVIPGTYTVTEDTSTDEFKDGNLQPLINNQTVNIKADNENEIPTVEFTNNKDTTGSLTIEKRVIDGENKGGELANGTYKFNLKDSSNVVIDTISFEVTNGSNASQTIDNLKPGTYIIEEVDIPEHMQLISDNKIQVVVSENNVNGIQVATFTNEVKRGSLKIQKNVLINNKSASGSIIADGTYSFTVTDINGDDVASTDITITNGNSNTAIINNLLPGTYTIRETGSTNSDATLLESDNSTITIEADKIDEIQTAVFTNNVDKPTGKLKIIKNVTYNGNETNSDIADGTYQFVVKDKTGKVAATRYISIKNGQSGEVIVDNLELGTYTIEETNSTNTQAILVASSNTAVEVTANQTTSIPTATFTNNVTLGELEITKHVLVNKEAVDSTIADDTYKFLVEGPNGYSKEVEIAITNGQSVTKKIKDLKPGTYTISEIDSQGLDIYQIESSGEVDNETKKATITINENTSGKVQVATVDFTNNLTLGSLQITKTTNINDQLIGSLKDREFEFTVVGPDGFKEIVKITVAKGETTASKTLSSLKPGTYTISETNDCGLTLKNVTSSGKVEDNKAIIEIKADNQTEKPIVETVEFTNNEVIKGSLEITKTVTINGEDVENESLVDGEYYFNITGPNNYTNRVAIEIENGKAKENVKLNDLELGTYTISEDTTGLDKKDIEVTEGYDGIVIELNLDNYQDEHVAKFNNDLTVNSTYLRLRKEMGEDNVYTTDGSQNYRFEITSNNEIEDGTTFIAKDELTMITFNDNKAVVDLTIDYQNDILFDEVVFEGLPEGIYTVKEVAGNIDGYVLESSVQDNSGNNKTNGVVRLEAGKAVDVTITNTYKQTSLTISKDIDETTNQYENATLKTYTFEVSNHQIEDGKTFTSEDGTVMTFNNGVARVNITGENSITFVGLPEGVYTVKEIDGQVDMYDLMTEYFDNSLDKTDGMVVLKAGSEQMIKITNSYQYNGEKGTMSITKIMENYNETLKGGTFAFKVTGTKVNDANETVEIYSGIVGVTVDDHGKYVAQTLTDLPIDLNVTYTVSEIYSGSYQSVNEPVVITLNTLEDIEQYRHGNSIILMAEFTNRYNNTTIGGSGVINIYGATSVEQIFE